MPFVKPISIQLGGRCKIVFPAAIQGSKDFVVPPLHPEERAFRQVF